MVGKDGDSTIAERGIAVAAWVWIPLVWILGSTAEVPASWRVAILVYGGYGLFESTATLADKRGSWQRALKLARNGSVAFAVAALPVAFLLASR